MPHLLYVEDDPPMRRSLVRLLERDVCAVHAVASYAEAMRATQEGGLWCGFIVDHLIPREPDGEPEPLGLSLLEALLESHPEAPGMLFTGVLARDVANRCAQLGVSYVLKSTTLELPAPFREQAMELAGRLRWPDLASLVDDVGITAREAGVLRLSVAGGRSRAQIAGELGISLDTVKSHVRSILAKAQCESMNALAASVQRVE